MTVFAVPLYLQDTDMTLVRKFLIFLALLAPLFGGHAWAATDTFTGSAAALATHDSNWFLADTGAGESLADFRIDGSGFLFVNFAFGAPRAAYTGSDCTTQKSEVVIPIGAFVTINAGEVIGVLTCTATGNKGFEATVSSSQLTGEVVNAVRLASNGSFITSQTLSPTIDTATVALTMSLQRTSSTNVDLIVNGTTYNVNTTGVDITSGQCGLYMARNNATLTTLHFDSWNNGSTSSKLLIMRRRH